MIDSEAAVYEAPWRRLFGTKATREVQIVNRWHDFVIVEDGCGDRNLFHPTQLRFTRSKRPWSPPREWQATVWRGHGEQRETKTTKHRTRREALNNVQLSFLDGWDGAWVSMKEG